MARQPTRRNVRPVANEYYVYDNRIKDVAGMEVFTQDGERRVRLSPGQAQYLMDQGAIGLIPSRKLSAEAKAVHKQMRRERHEG